MNRREFIKSSVGSFMVIRSDLVFGSKANSALRLGIIGCGSRGLASSTAMIEHTNTRMTAIADLFEDQLQAGKIYYNDLAARQGYAGIDDGQLFLGPNAFRELANSDAVDVVSIASPDYFHPQHLEAVVDAGKHCYCEKPIGVDVEGCLLFADISKKAAGRLSLDVGFQVRTSLAFGELMKRIHAGTLGQIVSASTFYHAPAINYPDRHFHSNVEKRIRRFYWDRILSGDVIVDQNIHVLDLCNWAIGAHPLKAVGYGGRKVRKDESDIRDHWNLIFTYPNDVQVSFSGVQFGEQFWDVGTRFFGDRGVGEAYYSGVARIFGDEPWNLKAQIEQQTGKSFSTAGSFDGLVDADKNKATAFANSIISGNYHNESAEGVESALTAILGRMAAYSNRETTWEEMLSSQQSYQGMIDLAKL